MAELSNQDKNLLNRMSSIAFKTALGTMLQDALEVSTSEIQDFDYTSAPANDQQLYYVGSTSKWTPKGRRLVITEATQALDKDELLCNSTDAGFNVTLPSSPAVGAKVILFDAKRTWDTNNVTVLRNGENINGAASDLTLNVEGQRVELIYIDSSFGWGVF